MKNEAYCPECCTFIGANYSSDFCCGNCGRKVWIKSINEEELDKVKKSKEVVSVRS